MVMTCLFVILLVKVRIKLARHKYCVGVECLFKNNNRLRVAQPFLGLKYCPSHSLTRTSLVLPVPLYSLVCIVQQFKGLFLNGLLLEVLVMNAFFKCYLLLCCCLYVNGLLLDMVLPSILCAFYLFVGNIVSAFVQRVTSQLVQVQVS